MCDVPAIGAYAKDEHQRLLQLKRIFQGGKPCRMPRKIWFARPIPGESKSAIEDLHTLRDPEFRKLSTGHYVFFGWRDGRDVYCVLAVSVYPDGIKRFVRLAQEIDDQQPFR